MGLSIKFEVARLCHQNLLLFRKSDIMDGPIITFLLKTGCLGRIQKVIFYEVFHRVSRWSVSPILYDAKP